jgi:hypothetical protein
MADEHKVAVIKVIDDYFYYDSYGEEEWKNVIDSITDWDTVTDVEYNLLKESTAFPQKGKERFIVLEQVHPRSASVIKTTRDYLNYVEKQKHAREQQEVERKAKSVARAARKVAKEIEKEKQLLAELQSKYGLDKK